MTATTQQTPRHLGLAHILEFVGSRCAREGRTPEQCVAECRRAANRFSVGQLDVVTDEHTGAVIGVTTD